MILDISGIELTPGAEGRACMGNGLHHGVECACDECDYLLCCVGLLEERQCMECEDVHCPRAGRGGSIPG